MDFLIEVKFFVNFASTLKRVAIINQIKLLWEKVIKKQEEAKLYLDLLA